MTHVVLAGDSTFDNAAYVQADFATIELLRVALRKTASCEMLASDGSGIKQVKDQLKHLPRQASHLFISCGTKDILRATAVFLKQSRKVDQALKNLSIAKQAFRTRYHSLLYYAKTLIPNVVVCTVFETTSGFSRESLTVLSSFNEIILNEAFALEIPVLDLRSLCNEAIDYSEISPNESSEYGGRKIANTIAKIMNQHDFSHSGSQVYA